MAKQTIGQRVARLAKDVADPEKGPTVDIPARWEKITDDLPEEAAEILKALGPLPEADLHDIPLKDAVYYAARDADATCRIDPIIAFKHEEMGLSQVDEIDLGAIPMFERMQSNGIHINRQHFKDFGIVLAQMRELGREEIYALAGEKFNIGSPDQVAYILFGKLGLESRKLTASKKRESTNEKVLQGMRGKDGKFLHPIIGLLIDDRELSKLKGTYADTLPLLAGPDDRIYGTFRITRTPTGQLAVSKPNLLAMPVESLLGREIRRGFDAPPGTVLGTWDLDQFHMRIMAHLSGDPTLCGLFIAGRDLHTKTASEIFGIPEARVDKMKHRFPAKRTGFGIINGITGVGLSAQFDKAAELGAEPHSPEECDRFIAEWFKLYPGVKRFQLKKMAEARRYGYARDMWGRIQYLPNIHSDVPALRAEAERQSFTLDTHGSAFGVLKIGMRVIWEYIQEWWRERPAYDKLYRFEPILQVHDELLFELTDDELLKAALSRDITDILTGCVKLRVPIGAHNAFGANWGDLEK